MGQIKRDCPHCHTKNSAFLTFGEVNHPGTQSYAVALRCNGCYGAISAVVSHRAGRTPHQFPGDLDSAHPHLVVHQWFPQPAEPKAPDSLPENAKTFYLQALRSLNSGNFDAASMMARKTLEVTVKALAPKLEGKLYNRIEALGAEGLITKALKDWAHAIRDDGNVASHEEIPVSKEFAEEILAFVEMFLLYTFTMPKMIEAKQKTKTPSEDKKNNEA